MPQPPLPSNASYLPSRRGQKIIYFLQNLSPRERQEFREYLQSPLLGNSSQGLRMLNIILEEVVVTGHDTLNIHQFQSEFFPNGKLDAKTEDYIWIRLSNLQEKLLGYLGMQEYQADKGQQGTYLLRLVRERGWEKQLPAAHKRALRANQGPVGAKTSAAMLAIAVEMAEIQVSTGQASKKVGLGEVMQHLDSFFVIQKLKYACGEFNQRLFGAATVDLRGVTAALQMANDPLLSEIPVIAAYREACRMLQHAIAESTDSETHYAALRRWLHKPRDFEPAEAMDLFTIAQNFAVYRHYQGVPGAMQDLKMLYDGMLQSGVVTDKGFISAKLYKNITMLMCRFGNLDWAETFVGNYQKRVTNDPDGMMWRFNRAVIHFHRGEFAKVVELMYRELTRFEDPSIGIGARIYFCRSLWMMEEYEWLLQQLKAFQQYLGRNREVASSDKGRYGKYVRYFRQLALAETSRPDVRTRKLKALNTKMLNSGEGELLGWLGTTIEGRATAS